MKNTYHSLPTNSTGTASADSFDMSAFLIHILRHTGLWIILVISFGLIGFLSSFLPAYRTYMNYSEDTAPAQKSSVNVDYPYIFTSKKIIYLPSEDASLIARFIDKDGSDMLNFEEFLFVLRGKPNEERQAIIDYVYSIFDKDHTGVADANEMRKVFNCQKHPKFKMGKLTESQMFYLYLKNFNNQVKMTVTKKVIKFFILI